MLTTTEFHDNNMARLCHEHMAFVLKNGLNDRFIILISHPSKVMLKVNLKRLLLKNGLGSEPGKAPQNRSSTPEFCVKSTFNISRIFIVFIDFKKMTR